MGHRSGDPAQVHLEGIEVPAIDPYPLFPLSGPSPSPLRDEARSGTRDRGGVARVKSAFSSSFGSICG